MLAKALDNSEMSLPPRLRGRRGESSLQIGRTYVVYAAATWGECICYAVCDENYPVFQFPVFYPAVQFAVVDTKIPSCWSFCYLASGEDDDWREEFVAAFPEWAEDRAYYERLVEGEGDALATFRARKRMIDEEAVVSLSAADRKAVLEE